MREKSRGKRADNGKFVYGYYFHLDGDDYILEKGTGFFTIRNGEEIFGSAYVHEVIPETVGKYTGLKDKDGKEACESDVLETPVGRAVICFGEYQTNTYNNPTHLGFYVKFEAEEDAVVYRKDITYWIPKSEIIGNIHENGDLL